MKKLLLFAALLAGFASCANDPEETVLTPDSQREILCTLSGDEAPQTLASATGVIDSTVYFTIEGSGVNMTAYGGQHISLPNGSYEVHMYFGAPGDWHSLHTVVSTTTGDISMGNPNANWMGVAGSGTLTIIQYMTDIKGTLYINLQPDPMEGKVRFSIGSREVFSGDTIMLRRGEYPVNPQFYTGGQWSNFHVAASTTTGDILMSSPNDKSFSVNGSGTLTMTQPGTNIKGTVHIIAPDESAKFIIDNTIIAYGNETVSLSKGSHTVYMLYEECSLHVAVYTTTGDIKMSSPNAPYFSVLGDGSLTISELGTGTRGTLYITATN